MVGLVEESATMRVTHREEARMRGDDHQQAGMWSYIAPEQRVPADHPLRPIRAMVDTVLAELSPEFAKLYSPVGRPSIPPGEAVAGAAAASALQHAERTAPDGATGLQPALPLVRRTEHG